MPTWTFVKKGGAPAGAIHISTASGGFDINDVSPTTIVTSSQQVAGELQSSAFLNLQGVTGLADPEHQVLPVSLVDGLLSKPGPLGTSIVFDGSELPGGGSGIPLSQKGAASGVMALDSSGIGAQPPKVHATAQHGRGGTDTMLNGLEISDTSANQSSHTFIFGPRTTTALTQPVATIQPKTAASVCALDISPSAGATAQAANGFAWLDIVDTAVIDATTYNGTSVRVGNGGTVSAAQVGDVSTRKFGSATNIPLVFAAGWDGSSTPQIYLSPQSSTNKNVLLGFDGSDVFTGAAAAPATTATRGGFLYLNTCAGAPTGVPAQVTAAWSAMRYDNTNHKLWVYDSVAAAWRGIVLT